MWLSGWWWFKRHRKAVGGGGGEPPDTDLSSFVGWSGAALYNEFAGRVGFRFTPTANLTVTRLGRWKVAGNTGLATLRLQTGAGADLATVTLDLGAAVVDQMNYAALGTPVALAAGTQYAVVSQEVSGGNFYGLDTNVYAFNSAHLNFIQAVYGAGTSGVFTTGALVATFGPVAFKYALAATRGGAAKAEKRKTGKARNRKG